MAKILIPTPLRPYTDKQDAVDATGATVGELLADLTRVNRFALEGECSVAGNDGRVGNSRKIGREGFCDAVREPFVLLCLSQIGERQHNDGKMRR